MIPRRRAVGLLSLLFAATPLLAAQSGLRYDVAITNVRAIDPETQLDSVRNIGILGDRIAIVSTDKIRAKRTLDGRGLVAAPGFIDLHSHAYGYETATYQAMDGVTTRLELEIGVYPVKPWYDKKVGHELINYGASVSHNLVRYSLQRGGEVGQPRIKGQTFDEVLADSDFDTLIHQPIPQQSYARFVPMLESGLEEGSIGIGSGTQYAPGISHEEMLDLTRLAGKRHTCVFTHIR